MTYKELATSEDKAKLYRLKIAVGKERFSEICKELEVVFNRNFDRELTEELKPIKAKAATDFLINRELRLSE